jgi:hypothetical protein
VLGLQNVLQNQSATTLVLVLSFTNIAATNGRPLPASALSGNAWGWTNADCARSRWWIRIGWRVWRVDFAAGTVEFRRI